jgi:hypothetical protein
VLAACDPVTHSEAVECERISFTGQTITDLAEFQTVLKVTRGPGSGGRPGGDL